MKWFLTLLATICFALPPTFTVPAKAPQAQSQAAAGGSTPAILWYQFAEQTGGTTADGSGNGRTGTLNNGTGWGGAGAHGGKVTFEGVDDNITASSVPFNLGGNGGVKIRCYVTPANTSSSVRAVWRTKDSSIGNFGLYHWNDNTFRLYLDGSSGDISTGAVTGGAEYLLEVIQPATSGAVQFWTNGVQVGTSSVRKTLATSDCYIGADEFPMFNPSFDGSIADFRIDLP